VSAWAALRYVRDDVPKMTRRVDGRPLVDPTARHVALAVALHVDRADRALVGLRRLATETGLHRNTVNDAIRRLEVWGVLTIDHRGAGKRHAYRFPVTEKLSTTVLPDRTLAISPSVLPDRTGCPAGQDTMAEDGWLNKEVSQADDPRGRFLPGTGWVPRYGGGR